MAFVQVQTKTGSSTSTTAPVAFNSNVQAGNMIIVSAYGWVSTPSTISDNQGNTYTSISNGVLSTNNYRVWVCMNAVGGATTVTVGGLSSGWPTGVILAEYSGHDPGSTPTVGTAVGGSGGATNSSITANAGDLLIALGFSSNNVTHSNSAGWSGLVNHPASNNSMGLSSQEAATTGSNTVSITTGAGQSTNVLPVKVAALSTPQVTTSAATSVNKTTVTLNGDITAIGASTPTMRGFVYDTTSRSDPGNVAPGSSSYASNATDSGSYSTGTFSKNLTGLAKNTTYYFRAVAQNTEGYKYGTELSFTTLPGTPLIDTYSATDSRFLNQVNGGDLDPFTSGQQIGFPFNTAPTVSVGSVTATNFNSGTPTNLVTLPATVAGDLLIALVESRDAGTYTPPSGWTQFGIQTAITGQLTAFYKIATASEGLSATWTSTASTTSTWQVRKFSNWHGSQAPEFVSTSGDNTSADPPSISPSWGSEQTAFLAVAGHASLSSAAFTAGPSSYTDFLNSGQNTGGSSTSLASAYRINTTGTENPGTFTAGGSNRYWTGATIAVRRASPIALTSGNTYYWKVRAKDPAGTNTWSAWSATRSFTVNDGSQTRTHTTSASKRGRLTAGHTTSANKRKATTVSHTTSAGLRSAPNKFVPYGFESNAGYRAHSNTTWGLLGAPMLYTAAHYDNTPQVYIEASFFVQTGPGTSRIRLYDVTAAAQVGTASEYLTTTSGTMQTQRGTYDFGPLLVDGHEYRLEVNNLEASDVTYVQSADIIVIQGTDGQFSKLAQYIPINALSSGFTSTSYVYPQYPADFLYEADKFSGTLTFYFEAGLSNDGGAAITYAELYDVTAGATVSGSEVSKSGTAWGRVRSGAITLVDGHVYRIRNRVSASTGYVHNANLYVLQSGSITKTQVHRIPSMVDWYTEVNSATGDPYPSTLKYVASDYQGLSGDWFYEVMLSTISGTGTAQPYNRTDAALFGTAVTTTSSTLERKRGAIATMPDDGDFITIENWSASGGAQKVDSNGRRFFMNASLGVQTVTKTHTTSANKRRADNTASHTTDANKKKATTLTHTTNAVKRQQFTRTHTTNALLRKQFTRTHTTDANKKKATTAFHTTSANKKKQLTLSHTTSAFKTTRFTRAHTTDALKKRAYTASHTTSSVKRKQFTLSHTTSANKRVAGNTRTHTTDAFKRLRATVSHTTDARLFTLIFADLIDDFNDNSVNTSKWSGTYSESGGQANFSDDGIVNTYIRSADRRSLIGNQFFFKYDPFVFTFASKLFYLTPNNDSDFIVRLDHQEDNVMRLMNGSYSTLASWSYVSGYDWIRFRESGGTFYVDTAMSPSSGWTNRYSASTPSGLNNAYFFAEAGWTGTPGGGGKGGEGATGWIDNFNVGGAQFTITHTTDALKRKATTTSHTTDANKKKVYTASHTTSANKKKAANTVSHTTSSNKKKANNTVSHTTSSFKRIQGALSHTTNALKRQAITRSHTTDALKRQLLTRTHTTNANKRAGTLRSHTTDANKRTANNAKIHSTDTLKRTLNTLSHTTNTLKRVRGTASHTTNSFLRQALTRSHTTDANLRKVTLRSHTTDANKKKANNVVSHTTSANKKKANNLVSHSTDALKRIAFTRSHTTDSFLRRRITLSHTTNALKRSATALSHTTNSNKRKALSVFHTTNANKKKAANLLTHTTDTLKKKENLTVTHTTDTFKRTRNTLSHTTNAFKRTRTAISHTTDAFLRSGFTLTHTTDANKRRAYTVSHTTSANKRKANNTLTHSTNALKRAQGTVSHTTNALKRQQLALSHTTNAFLRRQIALTHTTSANKRRATLVTHTTSSNKRKATLASHSTDANKKKLFTVSHTTSANKRKAFTASHTTNALKRQSNILSHSTDALKRSGVTLSHTTNALKRSSNVLSHSTDTLKRSLNVLSHSTDTVKRTERVLEHSTDALLRSQSNLTHTADAYKRKGNELVHTTDANKRVENNTLTHTTNAVKRIADIVLTHSTDANKRKVAVLTHSTDTVKRKTNTLSHTTNALKRKQFTRTHTTNANKRRAYTRTHTTNALKRGRYTRTHTTSANKRKANVVQHATDALKRTRLVVVHATDANKKRYQEVFHTTDANKKRVGELVSHSTDAFVRGDDIVVHNTDANKRKAGNTVDHTTDASKYLAFVKTHTTDSVKRKVATVSHTTSANKKKAGTVSHTTDSRLRKRNVLSHSTDAVKRKRNTVAHTTSANKRRSGTISHTTSSVKRSQTLLTHTTDSLLRERLISAHTTDAFLRKAQYTVHSTDANKKAAGQVSHTTDASLFAPIRVSHTTDANLYWFKGRKKLIVDGQLRVCPVKMLVGGNWITMNVKWFDGSDWHLTNQ